MAKKAPYLIGILLTIIIGTYLHCGICCDSCFFSSSNTTAGPLFIKDLDGTLEYTSEDNFNFNVSDYKIITPISYGVEGGIRKLFAYLGASPSKVIDVTGYYTSSETNSSAFPNLGIARASSIKNYLISTGISSKQINIKGKLNEDLINNNGITTGPLNIKMFTPSWLYTYKQEYDIKALGNKLKGDSIVLHFQPGQAKIDLTVEQRQEISDISIYLDKVDDASCTVTGHTDNTGGKRANVRLGQSRAEFVKNYLVENGLPIDKINAASDGPDSPIADNSTDEGKSKNRRTVITIN